MQRRGRVLDYKHDAIFVLEGEDGLAARYTFARVVALVLHELLGRDVVRERHQPSPPGRRTSTGWDSCGLSDRPDMRLSKSSRVSSSDISTIPSVEIATTVGKIPRIRSGPPVPTSSSAASNSASIAILMASSRCRPSLYLFLREERASLPPEPVAW